MKKKPKKKRKRCKDCHWLLRDKKGFYCPDGPENGFTVNPGWYACIDFYIRPSK